MTHTYNITGMTCNGCVAKAKGSLLKLGDVTEANVQLEAPQATITMQKHIPTAALQNALNSAGNYTITKADDRMGHTVAPEEAKSWIATYKPLLLVFAYITGTSLLLEAVAGGFSWMRWMRHFMAGFFLAFSFFKLLDVKGFAESYSSYDVVAKRWAGWGYVYPFVELGLGLVFLLNIAPVITNGLTFAVMGISLIGVFQSVLAKRKIQCACLGAVFNLPMSTVTIVEDALMMAMSGAMMATML